MRFLKKFTAALTAFSMFTVANFGALPSGAFGGFSLVARAAEFTADGGYIAIESKEADTQNDDTFIQINDENREKLLGISNPDEYFLGAASQFSVFLNGDFEATDGDCEGRLAAAGNANVGVETPFYSVGAGLENGEDLAHVVIGGDTLVNFSAGGKNFVMGENLTIGGEVATYMENGNCKVYVGELFDFEEEFKRLNDRAEYLTEQEDNAELIIDQYYEKGWVIKGEDKNLNVVTLNDEQAEIFNEGYLDLALDIPDGSYIVINVPGTHVEMPSTLVSMLDSDGQKTPTYENTPLLYNLYEATSFHYTGSIQGSTLAPNADATGEQGGHVAGATIAKSFKGGIEFGYTKFDYENSKVSDEETDTPAFNNLGDVNDDDAIDAIDASIELYIYAKISTGDIENLGEIFSEKQILIADVTRDGSIDSSDASFILTYYAERMGRNTSVSMEEFLGYSSGTVLDYKGTADNGFTEEEIAGSIVKPELTLTQSVITTDESKEVQTVHLSVSDAHAKYAPTGFHLFYDSRLTPALDFYGELLCEFGSAIGKLTTVPPVHNEENNSIFITTAGDKNYGLDGVLASINFELPEDAKPGDVYYFDLKYVEGDLFTNKEYDMCGKLMQAYTFTQGIYNKEYNNNFTANLEDILKCPALADIDKSYDGYIAIEGDRDSCETQGHEYTSRIVPPTCTEEGYTVYNCIFCDESYKDDYTDAKGHTKVEKIITEPECEKTGSKEIRCSACNVLFETVDIPEKGHSFTTETVPPTCTKKGYTVYECDDCDYSYNDDYTAAKGHNYDEWIVETPALCTTDGVKYHICKVCDYKEDAVINKTGHTAGEMKVEIEAKCLSAGLKTVRCTVCDTTMESEEIPAKGHSYKATVVPATCTEKGYTAYKCSDCGDNYKDNYTPAMGHTEIEKIVQKAECEKTGLKEIRCSVCDALIKTEDIPATGHDYNSKIVPPTCTKIGYTLYSCKNCSDTYKDTFVDAKGHEFGEWKVRKPALCKEDGVKYRLCKVCNSEETAVIKQKGHTAGEMTVETEAKCEAEGLKTIRCVDCDTVLESEKIPAKGHSYKVKRVPPTCTERGYTLHTCSACNDNYKDNYVNANGHTEVEKIIRKAECETDGSKEIRCSVCDDLLSTEVIKMTGHKYVAEVIPSKCMVEGYTLHTCSNCKDSYKDNFTEPLQHKYGEWHSRETVMCNKNGLNYRVCELCGYEDSKVLAATGHTLGEETLEYEASCETDGLYAKRCTECDAIVEKTPIPATGHSYTKKTVAADCENDGYTLYTCSDCKHSYKADVVAKTGHKYGAWETEKKATVFENGSELRICNTCQNKETKETDKLVIDIKSNTNYGIAEFTVVDAVTLKPVGNASIHIKAENEGECVISTDSEGKARQLLPVGKNNISVYSEGYLIRNITINIDNETQVIPTIGLSQSPMVEGELTVKEMTYDEIVEAGIDVAAPGNHHVYKYETEIEFEADIDWLSVISYVNIDGEFLGMDVYTPDNDSDEEEDDESDNAPPQSKPDKDKVIYYHYSEKPQKIGDGIPVTLETGEKVTIFPVNEKFFLIIYGEVKWLKEMFDVELLVMNHSNTDTIEDCVAELTLPEGLSLAPMSQGSQKLVQNIDRIAEGESASVHWYLRGDKEGVYNITASLKGKTMPFEEEFSYEYEAKDPVKVYAGSALHMTFEMPDSAFYKDDYTVKITLENVSDKPLYGVSHLIKGFKQGKITYYSDGTQKEEIYSSETINKSKRVQEFKPGDKIVFEVTTNILFQSEIIKSELEKLTGQVDGIETLYNGYSAVADIAEMVDNFGNMISNSSKNIDDIIENGVFDAEKTSAVGDLMDEVLPVLDALNKGDSKALSIVNQMNNSELLDTVKNLANSETAEEYLSTLSPAKIKAIAGEVADLYTPSEDDAESFNVFESIKNAIELLPVRFTVKNVTVTTSDDSTTEIPYSIEQKHVGARYFGVDNVGKYIYSMVIASMGEIDVPWYMQMLGVDEDPTGYKDAVRYVKATENQAQQFIARDTNNTAEFKVWVESEEQGLNTMKKSARYENDKFLITVNDENAVLKDGVLSFKGSNIITVTPKGIYNGVLCIEHEDGTVEKIVIETVEEHNCEGEKWSTLLESMNGKNGYEYKLCDTCKDVIDIRAVSQNGEVVKPEATTTTAPPAAASTTTTTATTTNSATSTTESTTATTTTVTTTTASTATTTTATSTTTTHIATNEELCSWAVNDYKGKTGAAYANAVIKYTDDDNAVITLTDATGNVLEVYTIDPKTGIGTSSDDEEVNLPQTGYSEVYSFIVLAAFAMLLSGIFVMAKSRKRNEE